MTLASLDGTSVARALVQVPSWGAWWADVDLTDAIARDAGASVTLAIGGVTLSGAVVNGGVANGRASYRIVGGAGGWGREVSSRAYRDDLGVRASLVLGDAARAAGETIDGAPSTRLGPLYTRAEGPASDVLHAVVPFGWRVDFDGVTRFGARPATEYTGTAARSRVAPGADVIELATEDVTALVPGVVVDGSQPATDVEYRLDDKRLTVRVYAGRGTSRRLRAIERIVRALTVRDRYRGVFEFRVVTQSGERLNLQPVRAATGLPPLVGVPVRPGIPGAKATALPGALVLVAFIDADPSRPAVVAHDAPDAPGWQPIALQLGGPVGLGIAYQGAPVQAGPFAGTVTLGSTFGTVRP